MIGSAQTGNRGEVRMENCRNCGAPLNKNGDCEYCGTVKQENLVRPYLEITADYIRIGSVPVQIGGQNDECRRIQRMAT